MRSSTRRAALVALTVIAVLVLAVVVARRASARVEIVVRNPFAQLTAIPSETEQFASEWPVAQGNLAATRNAANSSISSANLDRLDVAWSFDQLAAGAYGSVTANPIVVGDTVYIQDMQSNVFALDRATGSLRWKAAFNIGSTGPNGVTVGYGRAYATLGDTGEVVALDPGSGKEVWRQRVGSPPGEGIDMAPIAYGGLVYVSTVPGTSADLFYQAGDRGLLSGLDATNGHLAWSFDTTHGGWGAPKVAGGGGLWYPPSFDTAGNLYFGVGNPAPFPATPDCPNASCRPGDNEYTDSMVSLDGKTGGVRWFYQDRKHDLLGLDFQLTPILTSVTLNGVATPIAIGSGKTGNVVAVNADTGAVLWKTAVGKHQNDDVTALPADGYLEVFPGDFGGVESPIAYAGGTVFATYLDLAQYQGETGARANDDLASGTGGLVAVNVADGSVKWQVKINALVLGGATVANDVVFTSGLDGVMRAFNAETGAELWDYEAKSGFNAPPAIAGDMVFVGAGFVKLPSGGIQPAAGHGEHGAPASGLIAFKLRSSAAP